MNRSPMSFSCMSGMPVLAAALLALAGCSPSSDSASVVTSAAAQAKPQSQVAVARGKIDVEGGLLDLSAAAPGLVQQLLIKEGQAVQKGQLVLRMADDAARADLAVAESELQLAQTKLKTRQERLPVLKTTLARWLCAMHRLRWILQVRRPRWQSERWSSCVPCSSAMSCAHPRRAQWCAWKHKWEACCKAEAMWRCCCRSVL